MPTRFRQTAEIVYDYIDDIDPNLTCAICQSALVDPVTTTSCKHTFCRECITRAISLNPQCPIDRSVLSTQSLRDTEQLVKLMLDELKVKCAAPDCGMVMQRGLLLGHLRSCQKSIVMCQDKECGLSMTRKNLPHHRAYGCFQRKMECAKCSVMLTFRDHKRHSHASTSEICDACGALSPDNQFHQWSCPQARVPCTHSTRGCPAIISRSDLSTHLTSCTFELLSTFFENNDARLAKLEDKNRSLRSKVKELTTEVNTLRAENTSRGPPRYAHSSGVVRQAEITPWVGVNRQPMAPEISSNELPIPRPAVSTPPRQVEETSRRDRTSRYNSPTMTAAIAPAPGVDVNSRDTGITRRAADDIEASSRGLFSPSFGAAESFADYAFYRLPRGMDNDQIIGGLRNVVLHLASGMDTMERRNEVRMRTESLRILEDVGRLRAAVDATRMQVNMDSPTITAPRSIPVAAEPVPPVRESVETEVEYGSSPPGSVPFAAYHPESLSPTIPVSPDSHRLVLSDDEEETLYPRVGGGSFSVIGRRSRSRNHNVRESIAFTQNRSERSGSISSIVSSVSTASRNGNGRLGRPMGLPSLGETSPGTSNNTMRLSFGRTNPISLLSRRMTNRED